MLWSIVTSCILATIARAIQNAFRGTRWEPAFKAVTIVLFIFFVGLMGYQIMRLKAAGLF